MRSDEIEDLMHKGIDAAEKGYIHSAQVFFGQVSEHRKSPELHSYMAYCLAKGQGRIHSAAKICRESIKREPNNSLHFLILGRILLMSGDRRKAIYTFRQGLRASPNPRIIDELKKLGLRKPAPLKSLNRSHLVNRTLGRVFSKFGLR